MLKLLTCKYLDKISQTITFFNITLAPILYFQKIPLPLTPIRAGTHSVMSGSPASTSASIINMQGCPIIMHDALEHFVICHFLQAAIAKPALLQF